MKKMKKIALGLAAVLLLGVIAALPAAAENQYSSMLVLGDSISTGYGLENYTPGGTPYLCRSYANLLAESLSLKGGETYINRAVNGAASDDLLKLLPTIKNDVAESELVVISIGGNDLLHIVPKLVTQLTGQKVTGVKDAAQAVLKMDKAVLAEKLKKPELMGGILTAIGDYSKNLGSIIALLHEYNPNARVIFLAQYNPMHEVAEAGAFGTFAGYVIDSLNSALSTALASSGFGYEMADIPSVINVNADGYTNITDLDIHPNAEGHGLMGQYMIELVGKAPAPATKPVETVTTPETTPEVTDEETTEGHETTAAQPSTETTPDSSTTATGTAEKKGCGSAMGFGAVMAVIAGAVCLMKKRR